MLASPEVTLTAGQSVLVATSVWDSTGAGSSTDTAPKLALRSPLVAGSRTGTSTSEALGLQATSARDNATGSHMFSIRVTSLPLCRFNAVWRRPMHGPRQSRRRRVPRHQRGMNVDDVFPARVALCDVTDMRPLPCALAAGDAHGRCGRRSTGAGRGAQETEQG